MNALGMRPDCSLLVFLVCCAGWPHATRADGTLMTDDTWNYASAGDLAIDAGLVVGSPAALPTGLAMGIGAGITKGAGLTWGARLAWATATESSTAWTVTQDDFQLRVTGGLRVMAGRGAFGLRLGMGGTLVHESRIRNQGMRVGLSGSELESSTFVMLPAMDLDTVITLYIAGAWLMILSGGPSVDVLEGKLHGGWNAHLGVAWQP